MRGKEVADAGRPEDYRRVMSTRGGRRTATIASAFGLEGRRRLGLAVCILTLGLSGLATGCPAPSADGGGPVETCTKQFEQCRLPNGPLGVCDRRECRNDESEPCLVCMPQH